MIHNGRSAWVAVFVVTIILSVCQAVEAQREEGRRERGGPGERRGGGGFGSPTLWLAMNETVQGALKLSDEQKSKIEELDDQYRDDSRKLMDDGRDPESMQKLGEDTSAKLAEVLDEAQQKRLREISIQLMGAGAVLADPALAKQLEVTDEQKTKLRDAQQSNRRTRGDAFRELRDLSGDERRAKAEKMRADADKKLLDVLTPEQQEKLNSLKGEKVDIDVWQLWGRGRSEGRGGRGRGDRGDRDRDDDDSDKDKSA